MEVAVKFNFKMLYIFLLLSVPLLAHTVLVMPDTATVEINQGDSFVFHFEGEHQLVFKASSNVQINRAQIAEIKTLFKSNYYPFGNKMDVEDFSIDILFWINQKSH